MKANKAALKKVFEGIDRAKLARDLGKNRRNYIDQIAAGLVDVSPTRAKEIERVTYGRIPAAVLRPDIFA